MVVRDVDGSGQRWNRNTNVRVWIAPSVLPDLHQPIRDAVSTWAVHPKNSSGIIFTFVDAEPVDGSDTLIFRQQWIGTQPAQYSMDPVLKRATISLNSGITNPTAAGQTATHEVGHSYGMLDCWQCATGTSVMVERPADLNDTSWPSSPSECDIAGAMLGLGAIRKVESTRLPQHQKDNEMTGECEWIYWDYFVCWPGGHCQLFYADRPEYYCELVDKKDDED